MSMPAGGVGRHHSWEVLAELDRKPTQNRAFANSVPLAREDPEITPQKLLIKRHFGEIFRALLEQIQLLCVTCVSLRTSRLGYLSCQM